MLPPIPHPGFSEKFFRFVLCGVSLAGMALALAATPARDRVPVIFSTDIGDDIDDTWALGFLLKSPELEVKLVVGDYWKAEYRAKLLAKFLERAGRTEIPVGIGFAREAGGSRQPQLDWVKDYNLADFPGTVHEDGVQALIDIVMNSEEPVTIIAVGPAPNIAEALRREPRIAERAKVVGVYGSVRRGNGGRTELARQWNVRADVSAVRAMFAAPWEVTITPLDTCGLVHLGGDLYQRVLQSKDPIATAIIENYRIWRSVKKGPDDHKADSSSTILFDTVAVYLAFDSSLVTTESIGIRVTDDGYTRIDNEARPINVATAWKDLDAFKEMLVRRITADES